MEERQAIELKSAYDFIGLGNIYNICDDYLHRSAAEKGLSSPAEFTPGQWQNRLSRLCFQIFAFNPGIIRNIKTRVLDKAKVVSIYRYIYKELCCEYNQLILVKDFTIFIGISHDTINKWDTVSYIDLSDIDNYILNNSSNSKDSNTNLNIYSGVVLDDIESKCKPGVVDLLSEIKSDSESCLVGRMITDKGNPLRYLSILNFRHGWNKESSVSRAEKTLSLAEMRQAIGILSAGDGQPAQKSNKKKDKQQNKGNVLEK